MGKRVKFSDLICFSRSDFGDRRYTYHVVSLRDLHGVRKRFKELEKRFCGVGK